MRDRTVVYYSCCRERPEFEARIQKTLWRTIKRLRIPLISVSQKPMDFGENICVGDVGASSQNAYRQLQIGCQAAKTRFVLPAEADFLYPPSYFTFQPGDDDVFYVAQPLWVAFVQRGYGHDFCRKNRGSEAAMMVNREHLIGRIDTIMSGMTQWGPAHADGTWPYLLNRGHVRRTAMELDAPIVTFKTDRNMHRRTPHNEHEKEKVLPHWGSIYDLMRIYQP